MCLGRSAYHKGSESNLGLMLPAVLPNSDTGLSTAKGRAQAGTHTASVFWLHSGKVCHDAF